MATNPTLLTTPIAENGNKNVIPAVQAAAGDGLLSQSTGFPAETSLPLGAGGKAPTREDFNGALYLLSNLAFYNQKGWFFHFDANQAYFKGCVVRDTTDGQLYEAISDVSAGGSVPSADSDNWKAFFPIGKNIGEIFAYSGTTQPPGALLANHAAVSRTMYAKLFDEIGTKFGPGDGSTTFNLPDYTESIIAGNIEKTTYETAGSATFTAQKSGLYRITVKGAGGGGSGGARNGTTSAGSGSGGGEGGTTIGYEHLTAGDSVAVVVGAGGAGGAGNTSSTNTTAGAEGGSSTATINLTTYTGSGGYGGSGGAGLGGTGTINGAAGGKRMLAYSATTQVYGGTGGGQGGARSSSSGPVNGTQGGGGAGGFAQASTSVAYAGGAGGDGYVWIEYLGDATAYYIQAFNGSTDPALVDLTQIVQDLANRLTREQTPAFNRRDVVTTSGTYTAPVTGCYRIEVKGGGGGGRGGGYTGSVAVSGSGGCEGGTTIAYEHLTAGDSAVVVIGAGGTGGAASTSGTGAYGTPGGDSSVTVNNNTYTGGGGGVGNSDSPVGGGSGTMQGMTGGTGSYATASVIALGGNGGGVGGAPQGLTSTSYNGVNGGGGSGGAAQLSGSKALNGGNGGDGFAAFEYFAAS